MSKDKKDIDIEQIIEENLLPLLTQETCKILNQSQTELSKINWSSGESNLDKGFSELSRAANFCPAPVIPKSTPITDSYL